MGSSFQQISLKIPFSLVSSNSMGGNVLKKRAQPQNPHGATRVFPLRKLRVSAVSCLEPPEPNSVSQIASGSVDFLFIYH